MKTLRAVNLLQTPFMQDRNAICQAQRFDLVMGDVDQRLAQHLMETAKFDPELQTHPGVQIRQRFIEQY